MTPRPKPPFTLYSSMLGRRDETLIRIGNALAKSVQQMTLPENTLLMLALSRIGFTDRELYTHDLQIKEIQPFMGGNAYQEARKAADGLLTRVVHVEGEDGESKKYQWTTLSQYIPASKSATGYASIRVRLNQELEPFLLELKRHYSQTPMLHILEMNSFIARRLYQVLWADAQNGRRLKLTYAIGDLKRMIGLADAEGKNEKYRNWKDFKKILEYAQAAFAEHGTLHIRSFSGERHGGRAYTHIKFDIAWHQRSGQPALFEVEEDPEVLTLARRADAVGYNRDARALVRAHGAQVTAAALDEAAVKRGESGQGKAVANPGALLTTILREGGLRERLAREQQPLMSEGDREAAARVLAEDFLEARSDYAAQLRRQGEGAAAQSDAELLADYADDLPYELSDVEVFAQEGLRLRSHPHSEHGAIVAFARTLLPET